MSFDQVLASNTRLRSPFLCPEIKLHLLNPDAPIWVDRAEDDVSPYPYWGIAWGSGQAIARWILDHPRKVAGQRCVDLGCGSGIAGIAAALAGADIVEGIDISEDALMAAVANAAANKVVLRTRQCGFVDVNPAAFDLVLAADLGYLNSELLAWLTEQESPAQTILIAEPNRRGVTATNAELLATYNVRADPETEAFFVQQASVLQLCDA